MWNLIAGGGLQLIGVLIYSGSLVGSETGKTKTKEAKKGVFVGVILLIVGAAFLYFKPL